MAADRAWVNVSMIILGRHTSYNVQKVLWLADELSVNYQHEEKGGRFAGTETEEFLQLNPTGKVPVLITTDGPIRESNTIIRFLADQYAPNQWLPTDAFSRAQVELWMDWSIDVLEPAFVDVFWGFYRTPPDQRNNTAIELAVSRVEQALHVLHVQLENTTYLTADSPSVADIAVGVFMHRLHAIDIAVAFPDRVLAWYEQLSKRNAYRHWVMSDFSELKARLDY